MFKNAEIGDRVWDFVYEWGIIIGIDLEKEWLHILFDCGIKLIYDFEGRTSPNLKPRLFWRELKYEIPIKPIPIREILEENIKNLEIVPFVYDEANYYLEWNCTKDKLIIGKSTRNEKPILYFSKDSIDKLLLDIEKYNLIVTKDTFFELYFKIFYNIEGATLEIKNKNMEYDIGYYKDMYDRIVNKLKESIRPNTLDNDFFNAIDRYSLQDNGNYKVIFRQRINNWVNGYESFERWKNLILEAIEKEIDSEKIENEYLKYRWYCDDKVLEFIVYD